MPLDYCWHEPGFFENSSFELLADFIRVSIRAFDPKFTVKQMISFTEPVLQQPFSNQPNFQYAFDNLLLIDRGANEGAPLPQRSAF